MKSIKEIKQTGIKEGILITGEYIKDIFNSTNIEEIKSILYAIYCKKESSKIIKKQKIDSKFESQAKFTKVKLEKIANEFRRTLISKQTESEKIFKAILKSINVPYEFQKIMYTDKTFYIVDFYIPQFNKVIEIDGGYHETATQKKKDIDRSNILKSKINIENILRLTNRDVSNTNKVIEIVKHFLY